MGNVSFQVKAKQYVKEAPYIEWFSRDVQGQTRTYAPLQANFRVRNLDGLWGREFREIGVSWDFGDVTEDFSALSNLTADEMLCDRNRNTAISPRGSHVYRTPGTYYPTATLRDIAGNIMVLEGPEVVVTSADEYFTDLSRIYYFAQDNDFTDAPVGVNHVNLPDGNFTSYLVGRPFNTNNFKWMFKRGQANPWVLDEGTISYMREGHNHFWGAWGTGDKPFIYYSVIEIVISRDVVIQDLKFGGDYNPVGDNEWWTGDRFGVEGVDWNPKPTLDPNPKGFGMLGSERCLIDRCEFTGLRIFNGNPAPFALFIHDTSFTNYYDYGIFQGGPDMILVGCQVAQPDGTPNKATGAIICGKRLGWNGFGCNSLDTVPIPNNVVHAPLRNGRIPDLVSKCFFRAGGGHSEAGDIPQPALRITTGGTYGATPQLALDVIGYITQSHIVGSISTSNKSKILPFGYVAFDSCVIERNRHLTHEVDASYGFDVLNCIFLSRDTRTGGFDVSYFLGHRPLSSERAYIAITEEGGDHSEVKSWVFNNTFALIETQGTGIGGAPVQIRWEEWGTPKPPKIIGKNNAFFRVTTDMGTSEQVPLAAALSELDQTTFLPNPGTTFDSTQDGQYLPLDFNGEYRDPANAISGFKKRAV